MGFVNLKKIMVLSGIASVFAAGANAGQISKICSAKSITIASYTGSSTGVKAGTCYAVAYAQERTAAADKTLVGEVYTRGEPFYLTSDLSYSDFKSLEKCLNACSNSVSASAVASIQKKHAEAVAKATADKAEKKKKEEEKVAAAKAKKDQEADNGGGKPADGSGNKSAATGDTGSGDPLKDAIAAQYAKNGSNVIKDKDGNEVLSYTTSDGQARLRYLSGPNKGQVLNDSLEHIGEKPKDNYTTTGYSGSSRSEWTAAMKANGGTGTVTYADGTKVDYKNGRPAVSYDKDGKPIHRNSTNKGTVMKDDECSKSQDIDPSYTCNATYGIAKATDVGNTILTGAGRMVVTQMGAAAAQSAMKDGSIASSQDAAAKMAKTSFTYETGLTVANLAAAAALSKKTQKHKQNIAKLKPCAESRSTDKYFEDPDCLKEKDYEGAIIEQRDARNTARDATFKAAMVGAQSLAGAIVAKNNQKAAERNARYARDIAAKENAMIFAYNTDQLAQPGPAPTFDPNLMAGTADTNTTSSSSSDNGIDPNAPTGPMLGDGNDLGGGDSSLGAPMAGSFKGGAGATSGGAAGGGGAGAGGGGSTGSGPSGQEESKAAYASEFGTKERYESGGGTGGAKGGAAKGGKDDGGIDLNGLLAQFLPKSEDDLGAKNGILDSVAFGGNRKVAEEEAPSYLDKNADLFQRIHETMSEKNRRGQLGI